MVLRVQGPGWACRASVAGPSPGSRLHREPQNLRCERPERASLQTEGHVSTSADLAAETVLPLYPQLLGIHGASCSTCTNVMEAFTGAERVAVTPVPRGQGHSSSRKCILERGVAVRAGVHEEALKRQSAQ